MLIAIKYDFSDWKEKFVFYLENNGYKSGTAHDYAKRIEKIIANENITIETLFVQIDKWIDEYKTGAYAHINKRSHHAWSCALMKFKEFSPLLGKPYHESNPNYESLFSNKPPFSIIY